MGHYNKAPLSDLEGPYKLGNEFFAYYDTRQAEAITLTGQLTIRWIETKLNIFLNEMFGLEKDWIIGSDTDSVVLNLSELVEAAFGSKQPDKSKIVDFLDKTCKEIIQPEIDRICNDLSEYLNSYEQRLVMKRESIADKGIWTAKKRYVLNVWDSEGVRLPKPKLKIMGIEVTRSSTPKICRESIKEAIRRIVVEDETSVQSYIKEFRQKFFAATPEEVAFPRSVRGLDEYSDPVEIYKKATPIAVKAALLYNHQIKTRKELKTKYPLIGDSEKIRFLYLKEPNPIKNRVIGFTNRLPKEFGVDKYVDYETQFEKTFLEPVNSILDIVKWKHKKEQTLEDFFA